MQAPAGGCPRPSSDGSRSSTPSASCTGYELLFRSSFENCARILESDFASAEVALDAFLDFGLDTLVGDRRAFVNVTRAVLLSGLCWQWPRERVVLEILEDVPCDDEVVREVEALASSGYRSPCFREELRRVLPFASLVKIDISAFTAAALGTQLEILEAYPAALVAERVETPANLDDCRELGFTYFQGFFFARPIVLQGRRIPIERLTALRVLALLADDEAPLGPLVEAIAAPSDSWDRSGSGIRSSCRPSRRRGTARREAGPQRPGPTQRGRWAPGAGRRSARPVEPERRRVPSPAAIARGGAGRPRTLERGAAPRSRKAALRSLDVCLDSTGLFIDVIRVERATTGASVRLACVVTIIPTHRITERSERPSSGRFPASRKRASDGPCRHGRARAAAPSGEPSRIQVPVRSERVP